MVWGVKTCIEKALIENDGLLTVRNDPRLRWSIARAFQKGILIKLGHGVYCDAERATELTLRARAVIAMEPTAVITGRAAVALSWRPETPVPELTVAHPLRIKENGVGIRWQQARIPEELILEQRGIRITSPALSVLDLIPDMGGFVIDEALRLKAVRLADLQRAFELTPGRRGNTERAWLLADSKDEPWSEAERAFHRVLRELRLPCPYYTNYRVAMADGTRHPIDVALKELLLGFEIDGFAFHHQRTTFERDRAAEVLLAQQGWQIVRIAASEVFDNPHLADKIQRIIDSRAALLSGGVREG